MCGKNKLCSAKTNYPNIGSRLTLGLDFFAFQSE